LPLLTDSNDLLDLMLAITIWVRNARNCSFNALVQCAGFGYFTQSVSVNGDRIAKMLEMLACKGCR
jgi:hypothetical protein